MFFNKQKDKESIYKAPPENKVFKELPLWNLEPFIMVGLLIIVVGMLILDRLGLATGISFHAAAFALIVSWGLFLIKWILFMPRKNKPIVIRVLEGGGMTIKAETIPSTRQIWFTKKDDKEIPPVNITDFNKHREITTGSPVIVVAEGTSNNIDIIESISEQGEKRKSDKEFNMIVKNAYDGGYLDGLEVSSKFKTDWLNPTTIAIGILLVAMLLLFLMQMNIADTLSLIAENLGVA